VRVIPRSTAPDRLGQLLVLAATFGVLAYLILRQRNGGLRMAKFAATPTSRQLTLADVGGAAEAQADLRDVIGFLKDPVRFQRMGAKCPKGILLVGPPGTGKTLLARAVAGEAGRPVIVAAGSEFNEMYVGVGSQRIRTLAAQARAQAPCIVFIDEFDSLGGRRGRPNRTSEEETTLNQLLVEMDGMTDGANVVWMAATNREDMLDPAVRRPGRFDRVVEVGLPTTRDRQQILRIHARTAPLADDVDLERLAALTVGYSGAELANLLNEAAIYAVQAESEAITNEHVELARDKILLGRIRSGVVVTDEERRVIALHEAGHAIVGLVACPDDALHKVTIEARGRSLGAAHFAPAADRHLHSRRYLGGVIAKALGGRAAELVFLGRDAVTSGAGGDLVHATSVARRMVAEFGMSDDVGLISADPAANGGAVSAQLQARIDDAVRSLTAAQAERAERIVRQYRGAVDAVADALLDREVLSADEVHLIAARHGIAVGEANQVAGVLSAA
jgi:cell division protease FtsH